MNSSILICIFLFHFIADFLLQPRWMGTRKSSEIKVLIQHLSIQFIIMFIGLVEYFGIKGLYFALINALIHGIIDWNIWKLYKLSAHFHIKKQVSQLVKDNYNKFYTSWIINPKNLEEFKRTKYDELVQNWKYWEDSKFYDTIGFDQFLHGATLIALASWLL